ncbi:MAG TPA: hypothetical protein PLZ51_02815, partial [Aggregatilineales bacterium]|nr:hypothetical protein [Aggregatilineales bacterium]
FTVACVDCHEALVEGEGNVEPVLVAEGHGAIVPTVPQDPSLPLIQGVLLGGGFGVTVMAFVIQSRKKRNR